MSHYGNLNRGIPFFARKFTTAPRYETLWDPAIMLQYLSTLLLNEDLALDVLSMKLVTILALVTAHRIQTFAAIEITNIEYKENGIEIKIPTRLKTSRKGENNRF